MLGNLILRCQVLKLHWGKMTLLSTVGKSNLRPILGGASEKAFFVWESHRLPRIRECFRGASISGVTSDENRLGPCMAGGEVSLPDQTHPSEQYPNQLKITRHDRPELPLQCFESDDRIEVEFGHSPICLSISCPDP